MSDDSLSRPGVSDHGSRSSSPLQNFTKRPATSPTVSGVPQSLMQLSLFWVRSSRAR